MILVLETPAEEVDPAANEVAEAGALGEAHALGEKFNDARRNKIGRAQRPMARVGAAGGRTRRRFRTTRTSPKAEHTIKLGRSDRLLASRCLISLWGGGAWASWLSCLAHQPSCV